MTLDTGNVIMYVLDVFIVCMFAYMVRNSLKVKLETRVGNRYIVPILFLVMAVVSFVTYSGVFRIIQTVLMAALGIMYYFLKSGLAEDGIVMTGSFLAYAKCGQVTLSKKDSCVYFTNKGRQGALYFQPEQFDDVREFLKSRSISSRAK